MQRMRLAVSGLVTALLLSGCTALPVAQTAPPDYAASTAETVSPAPTAQPAPQPPSEPQSPAPEADAPKVVAAQVVRVVDGDTAVFRLAGGKDEKTRFIGIDTPESTNSIEVYGKEAAAYTARVLTQGRDVYLQRDVEERDRYGRLLAYVWLERPASDSDAEMRAKMFNAHLVLEGYAQQMTIQPNSAYAESFTRYVREARDAEKGLWNPAVAGGGNTDGGRASAEVTAGFIGNLNSMIFHEPTCSSVDDMSEKNKQPLASREEALNRGFRGCKRCNP